MYKALDLWLPAYLRRKRRPEPAGVTDILLAVCDHFEPLHEADPAAALHRIRRWQREFPALIRNYADADGCRPRHTFFYPVEQYRPELIAELAALCGLCGGETEVHLHHEGDTAATLRRKLERGRDDLARHGLLARDAAGNIRYGFIHGDWALANSHPRGRFCGVDAELGVLRETGCYADFTLPAAPDPAQTRIINSLYYAADRGRRKSHDAGEPARVGVARASATGPSAPLLLVQGPLGLNWERRKFGLLPAIENGEITGANPPRPDRMKIWMRLGIHVQDRPDWVFIKLHTHGGVPPNMSALLGDPLRRFYDHLLARYNDGKKYRLHFVTAREMVNILHAAEEGCSGDPGLQRDRHYRSLSRPPEPPPGPRATAITSPPAVPVAPSPPPRPRPSRLRSLVGPLLRRAAWHSGWSTARAKSRKAGRILVLHGVGGEGFPARAFADQMRHLQSRFSLVSLGDLVERLGRGAAFSDEIALTFDDGLRNNLTFAYPVLERLKIPATFFICPGLVETGRWLWTHEARVRLARLPAERRRELLAGAGDGIDAAVEWMKTLPLPRRTALEQELCALTADHRPTAAQREMYDLMNWDELKSLDPSLITLGSHSLNHPILTTLTADELVREVRESRRLLELRLQRPAEFFCYPNGTHNDAVVREVARHYRAAVTTRADFVRPGCDPCRLPRLGVASELPPLAWRLHRPSA